VVGTGGVVGVGVAVQVDLGAAGPGDAVKVANLVGVGVGGSSARKLKVISDPIAVPVGPTSCQTME
jgi:hypothetical protein